MPSTDDKKNPLTPGIDLDAKASVAAGEHPTQEPKAKPLARTADVVETPINPTG